MAKLRILVVEDSLTIRKRLIEVLSNEPDFEVIGEAADGRRGYELCMALRPDVVTLDMMLPEVSGLAATEFIMAYCPTPILIVSSSTNRGELFKTYDALAAGAVDVFEKPNGSEAEDHWEMAFVLAVRLVARIKVITHPRARLKSLVMTKDETRLPNTALRLRAIAMGASTGGPGAMVRILSSLPPDFPLPILLVMHLSPMFAGAFGEWLATHANMPVTFTGDGEALPLIGQGRVLLAPPGKHLVVESGKLRLTDEPERNSCRPSIDVLFESAAHEIRERCLGVLLTGMGRDGAEGLLAIRRSGGTCFVQDEASSTVFGMPREAIRLGAADRVLALEDIAPAIAAAAQIGTVQRRV